MKARARITFVHSDGQRETVEIAEGRTVMEGARDHGVAGIEAWCGGQCLCSTCHCYVAEGWYPRLSPPDEAESALLEFAWEPRATSRLTCQLRVTDSLDGLELEVPERQL